MYFIISPRLLYKVNKFTIDFSKYFYYNVIVYSDVHKNKKVVKNMSDSRTFVLQDGITVEAIGDHLVAWLQATKGMVAEGGPAQGGGYFVQAKEEADGWKKMAGLTKAVQIQLLKADSNVVVNCGFGKWSDKVGAGALGMFVFAPLAATAAIGAFAQSKLPNEVFAEIEKFIINGGKSAIVTMGVRLNADEISCPSCGAKNPKGQKFCSECGAKMGKTCPSCGADVDGSKKFCPECGSKIDVELVCKGCGATLEPGKKFCSECGTPC